MKYKFLYLMLIPGILYFIIFRYVPMLGLVISFKDFNFMKGIIDSPWAGLKYFRQAFTSPSFFQVFRNTVAISLLKLAFGFPAPILLALSINEVANRTFKRFFQTVSYLPYFISWVTFVVMINDILSPNGGIVNQLLASFGTGPIFFTASSRWFRTIVVASDVVKSCGWTSIIYLSALTSIDPQLYDAAVVDGCDRWKQTWHITLASIRPIIVIVFILSLGNILNAGFEQIYVMQNDVVMDVGDIIDTWVYTTGLRKMQYSFATAVGLFKSVISFTLVLGSNMAARRMGEEGIWSEVT